MNNQIWNEAFIDAYCDYFKCKKQKFYNQVLWSCYWWHFPFVQLFKLVAFICPSFVAFERNVLLSIANTNCDREFYSELGGLNYLFHRDAHILKKILHLRLSEKKLEKLKVLIIKTS